MSDPIKDALLKALGLTPSPEQQPPPAPAQMTGSILAAALGRPAPTTFRDSVTAITGTPRLGVHEVPMPVVEANALSRNTRALYNPIADYALVGKGISQSGITQDHAFAHEMGHRLNSFLYGDPRATAAFDSATALPSSPKPTGYAATNKNEQFAEAFANAIQLLRDTAEPLPSGPGRSKRAETLRAFHEAEQSVPGTLALTKYLLNQPLYAQHQAQRFRDDTPPRQAAPYAVLPDDTAVRKP